MLFLIYSWESTNEEGQVDALIYTILYKVVEHSWILVSTGFLRTNHKWVPRDTLSFWEITTHTQIFDCAGSWHHQSSSVQGSTIYIYKYYSFFVNFSESLFPFTISKSYLSYSNRQVKFLLAY